MQDSEEIDEHFREATMEKAWTSAGDQNNDRSNLEVARQSKGDASEDAAPADVQATLSNSSVPTSQVQGPGSRLGENHTSPDPLFKDLFGEEDGVEPAQQLVGLEPIQPGSERFHFSPNPQYDPFAPEDDEEVPAPQAPQVEASRPNVEEDKSSLNPMFDEFFDGLVPELTPEAVQELGESLGLSGSLADYESPLEQGVAGAPLAAAETAMTGSKRKPVDQEAKKGSKKVRLPGNSRNYTPYQPRQDKPRVPIQHPRPTQNHRPLPPYVSSTSAPPLAQGELPRPTATAEKPSTTGFTTLMPPSRHRRLPAKQTSRRPPPSTGTEQHGPASSPARKSIAQPTPDKPQRHQALSPYQPQLPRFPASHNIPPTPAPTPANTTRPTIIDPAPSQPPARSHPPPQAAAAIDHRFTTPTTAAQIALIIKLLEPTIAQFETLLKGTPFEDHIVDTDMRASYMTQYQHIVRELDVLWRSMNWDRSALPNLKVEGPFGGERWEGR